MNVSFPNHVVRREVHGETVLMNRQTSLYYGLDAMGTRMISRLERGEDAGEIAAGLAEEFDVTTERALADLQRLVSELEGEGLIVCRP